MKTDHDSDRTPAATVQTVHQIALLLHSLPERTHRALVGQLAEKERRAVAEELQAIQEVDALEQYRVLKKMREELLAETATVDRVESEIHDEIQIGRARVTSQRSKSFRSKSVTTAASEAASVQASNQSEATRQPPTDTHQVIPVRFEQTQAAGVVPDHMRTPSTESSEQIAPASVPFSDARPSSVSAAETRRPAGPSKPNRTRVDGSSSADPKSAAIELAERIDDYLVQLPPERLCLALGQASTKQAFLVLCGLPNEIAEAALALLPQRQARQVRTQMRRIGRLHLSEIDQAKQQIAQIAMQHETEPMAMAA